MGQGNSKKRNRSRGQIPIYLSILSRATDRTPYYSLDGRFMTVKITGIDPNDRRRGTVVFFIDNTISTFLAEFDHEIPQTYLNCLVETRIWEMIGGCHFRCEFVYQPLQSDQQDNNRSGIYQLSTQHLNRRISPPNRPLPEPPRDTVCEEIRRCAPDRTPSYDNVITELEEIIVGIDREK